jgi:hypothetical protein
LANNILANPTRVAEKAWKPKLQENISTTSPEMNERNKRNTLFILVGSINTNSIYTNVLA